MSRCALDSIDLERIPICYMGSNIPRALIDKGVTVHARVFLAKGGEIRLKTPLTKEESAELYELITRVEARLLGELEESFK